ncbi:GNAT family N-acetyltransferase [Microbacteriaceae bacterium 4G12]
MNIQIIETEQQLQDAFSVRRVVFVDEQQVDVAEEYDEFDKLHAAVHVILYDEGTPVGTGRMRNVDGVGKMERICILSSHRGKGAGRLIMEALEAVAKKQGLQKAKLHGQTHAEVFYQKLGYETVSNVFLEANIPHVIMTKSL